LVLGEVALWFASLGCECRAPNKGGGGVARALFSLYAQSPATRAARRPLATTKNNQKNNNKEIAANCQTSVARCAREHSRVRAGLWVCVPVCSEEPLGLLLENVRPKQAEPEEERGEDRKVDARFAFLHVVALEEVGAGIFRDGWVARAFAAVVELDHHHDVERVFESTQVLEKKKKGNRKRMNAAQYDKQDEALIHKLWCHYITNKASTQKSNVHFFLWFRQWTATKK